ncbi:FecR family protein [Pseudomonas sp. P115]|uniref:FecR family protein n=1 Tax=Pseudomonas pisciculturae TaxID=2730413 RepID=UPI00135B4106|nr:FecR family protein [Pseudomonas pisciculturae]MBF6030582.1 FecR family protein [Pseudomonas pisciculturae]
MNNQPSPSSSERDQQALDWWTRLRNETITAQQRAAFELWRADPLNANAYQNVEMLWKLLERPAHAVRHSERQRPASRRAIYAAAACVLLAFATLMLMTPPLSTWGSDYATAAGQQQVITLADGSQLHLDTDSAVDITLNRDERRVHLLRGRVFLEVVHDGRPFVVRSGDTRVQVLGTAFAVSHGADEDDVTLLRGRVEVMAGGKHQPLQPGEQLKVINGQIQAPVAVDADRLLAWRNGQLQVRNAPLRDVLDELMRYQGGHVVWLDDQAAQRPISASFNLKQIDSALDALISAQKLRTTALTRRVLIVRG